MVVAVATLTACASFAHAQQPVTLGAARLAAWERRREMAAGSPFETMTDDRRAVFQRMVDDFYGRFTALVRESRPNQ